jgi:hypothetical protein
MPTADILFIVPFFPALGIATVIFAIGVILYHLRQTRIAVFLIAAGGIGLLALSTYALVLDAQGPRDHRYSAHVAYASGVTTVACLALVIEAGLQFFSATPITGRIWLLLTAVIFFITGFVHLILATVAGGSI